MPEFYTGKLILNKHIKLFLITQKVSKVLQQKNLIEIINGGNNRKRIVINLRGCSYINCA